MKKGDGADGTEPILAALARGPMSGYQIHKLFTESVSNFWWEGFGKIYPGLKTLEEFGLVERLPEATDIQSKRPVYFYRMTDGGRERYEDWLHEPFLPQRLKNEMLLKLFFCGDDSHSAAAHLHHWGDIRRQRLENYRRLEREESNRREDSNALFNLLVLKQGIRLAEADVLWVEEGLLLIEEAESKKRKTAAKLKKEFPDPQHRNGTSSAQDKTGS